MDINTLRSIVTVVTFIVFIGIVRWAMSRRNQASFEEAAKLPFGHDD
jgi:cytochrome c oxidase cbb3-type subunit 4